LDDLQLVEEIGVAATVEKDPVVALLDSLPLANHALLAGCLMVDDPDGWELIYEVKDRVHGTAMASLILHSEQDASAPTLSQSCISDQSCVLTRLTSSMRRGASIRRTINS
jgi:hypothetical protein